MNGRACAARSLPSAKLAPMAGIVAVVSAEGAGDHIGAAWLALVEVDPADRAGGLGVPTLSRMGSAALHQRDVAGRAPRSRGLAAAGRAVAVGPGGKAPGRPA